MLLVEIGKAAHRVRTYVLGALLTGVALLPVIILSTAGSEEGGPPFFDLIPRNGLFASLTAVALIQPFILPLGAALLSGETLAGEATAGTLRYLLVRPVGRVRLVGAKYGAVMALLALAVIWVLLIGMVSGGIAYGFGPLPTLSGTTLSGGAAAARLAAAAGYVLLGVAGVAAIGVFVSTITESAPGATVATVAFVIISQILDAIPSVRALRPYLLTHDWLAFTDLFRSPVAWDAMRHGVVVFVAYTVVFLGASLAIFTRKDVVS
ncbi:MAG: ABC transporter permease [Actinomycetota bacterium]